MTGVLCPQSTLRVSLSNIQGEGAVQLVESLLPALERQTVATIGPIDLPDRGSLAAYRRQSAGPVPVNYRRRLPNALSRLIECLRPVPRDDPSGYMLVLGDLPLRTRARQTVFVHNVHLLAHQRGASHLQAMKFAVMRAVFRRNLRYVTQVVVQTELMSRQLVHAYSQLDGRVHVLRQPPPNWLLTYPRPEAITPFQPEKRGLQLFYPAASYPHKNHRLIEQLVTLPKAESIVDKIVLTLDRPRPSFSALLDHVGHLDPDAMCRRYAETDALFFPSLAESYGLPLIEAMWLGLPILCADLPYAHELCGNMAIYFDPQSSASALAAIRELRDRLATGWRPDWRRCLEQMPRNWEEVAHSLIAISVS